MSIPREIEEKLDAYAGGDEVIPVEVVRDILRDYFHPTTPPEVLAFHRFGHGQLDEWFSIPGTPRRLKRGVDFPEHLQFEKLRHRLRQAAYQRFGKVRVWRHDDGDVSLSFWPWEWSEPSPPAATPPEETPTC